MSLDHKTSEAFKPKNLDSLGRDNVVEFDRIFAVKGHDFQVRFLGETVMPVRQDVAVMALQQILSKATMQQIDQEPGSLVEIAFKLADAFCQAAPRTLDRELNTYFDLYMQRGKIDDIMRAQMELSHDWSL